MWGGYKLWPIIGGVSLLIFLLLDQLFFHSKEVLLSPWGGEIFQKLTRRKIEVVGFLPYWNVVPELQLNFSALDQLIYFGLTVNKDGLLQTVQNGEAEPGWRKLTNGTMTQIIGEAKRKHKKVLLSLVLFDAEIMDDLLQDKEKKQSLIDEVYHLVQEYQFDGVDVDFEYFPGSDNLENFGRQFNQFLRELKAALNKDKNKKILSVDIYPKAFIYGWPYQLPELGNIADQIIIMAYDYTQSNSQRSGPIAPLKSQNEKEMSVVQTLQAALNQIEKKKLVLGIPLYGYEWWVVNEAPRSATYWRSGEVASYSRVKELIKEKKLKVEWDEVAYSPWLNYRDGWQLKQIYFENLKSLSGKIELAQQLGLSAIAFWALGYEGKNSEIWDLLEKKL